ncbi:hypothetical protein FA95DRAFT_1614157, partial [Auriscalpium vulgare]
MSFTDSFALHITPIAFRSSCDKEKEASIVCRWLALARLLCYRALPTPSISLPPKDCFFADFELNAEPLRTVIAGGGRGLGDGDWEHGWGEGVGCYHPAPPSTLDEDDDEDVEEGISTIKLATPRPKPEAKPLAPTIDEDFESVFALPSDLTQLSLRPLSH